MPGVSQNSLSFLVPFLNALIATTIMLSSLNLLVTVPVSNAVIMLMTAQ